MMGKNIAVTATFSTSWVISMAARHTPSMIRMGCVPTMLMTAKAMACAIPVFDMAIPSTMEPARLISARQLTESMAWLMVQQRKSSMARAAITVPCNSDTTSKAVRTIIAVMISDETMVLGPIFMTSWKSENCNSGARCST